MKFLKLTNYTNDDVVVNVSRIVLILPPADSNDSTTLFLTDDCKVMTKTPYQDILAALEKAGRDVE